MQQYVENRQFGCNIGKRGVKKPSAEWTAECSAEPTAEHTAEGTAERSAEWTAERTAELLQSVLVRY